MVTWHGQTMHRADTRTDKRNRGIHSKIFFLDFQASLDSWAYFCSFFQSKYIKHDGCWNTKSNFHLSGLEFVQINVHSSGLKISSCKKSYIYCRLSDFKFLLSLRYLWLRFSTLIPRKTYANICIITLIFLIITITTTTSNFIIIGIIIINIIVYSY